MTTLNFIYFIFIYFSLKLRFNNNVIDIFILLIIFFFSDKILIENKTDLNLKQNLIVFQYLYKYLIKDINYIFNIYLKGKLFVIINLLFT